MKEGGQDGKVTSYGLRLSDLEALKSEQSMDSVEMIGAINSIKQTGNLQHQLIEAISLGYKVPKIEYKEVFHVILDNPLFDEGTGQRIDRGPVVQKFSKAAFRLSDENGGFMAKIAVILHNPIKASEFEKNPEGFEYDEKENTNILSVEAEIKAEELASENEILKQELRKMKQEKEATNIEEKKITSTELTEEDLEKILAEEEATEKGKEAKNV